MTDKEWLFKNLPNTDIVETLQNELGIPRPMAQLLAQRNITSFDEAKEYFKPEINYLHDPFLMKDMDKASERLKLALENEEKILVYGDYDVDGTTSVSLVYRFLKQFYDNVIYYIPDRYREGYGVSMLGIDFAIEQKVGLLITLDCGIKANKQIAHAHDNGIDVIVCDHHNAQHELPQAYAVLDPQRPDCSYPYKYLSGCGVGFKLLQAFCLNNNIDQNKFLYKFLDIVVVSIASDIVPMTGENRVLSYFGMKVLQQRPSIGIKAILEIAGIADSKISINDIVFKIGPRINAAGRIESGSKSVELLISENWDEALEIVAEINSLNSIRKDFDSSITDEALSMIKADTEAHNKKSTVLYKEDWHKGVIGIVASRVIESYYKPTIIFTKSKGKATGSARSVDGFDIYGAICKCSHLLTSYGGHTYAAGLTCEIDKLPEFIMCFEDAVYETITEEMLVPKIAIDLELDFGEITNKMQRLIARCEPFGPKNMTPVFCTRGLVDSGTSKIVGETKEHVKLELCDPETGIAFNAIAFSFAHMMDAIKTKKIDVCYTIEENTFRGNTSLQLMVRDIKVSDEN